MHVGMISSQVPVFQEGPGFPMALSHDNKGINSQQQEMGCPPNPNAMSWECHQVLRRPDFIATCQEPSAACPPSLVSNPERWADTQMEFAAQWLLNAYSALHWQPESVHHISSPFGEVFILGAQN